MLNGKLNSAALLPLLLALSSVKSAAAMETEWRFRVLLDDREIGYHSFTLEREQGMQRLVSEANFEVRVLFVKLFEYQHRNEETWQGNCLDSIDSVTDSNGRPFRVRGQRRDGQFLVQGSEGTAKLPSCVMSFAYWNPEFLHEDQLLNSQNGEYLPVDVAELGLDQVWYDGSLLSARRYRLRAGDMDLMLWYSEQDEWLALETEAAGGRRLRYERL